VKHLAIWVFGVVAGVLLGSCAIGIASVELGGRDAIIVGRDIGIFIIAVMTWISAVIGFAIWFGLAAGVGATTDAVIRSLRWVGKKSVDADEATARFLERFVVRPFAVGVGFTTTATTARRIVFDRLQHTLGATVSAARDALDHARDVVIGMRRRGNVVISTGVPVPPDEP
jgi:hypothetical protein